MSGYVDVHAHDYPDPYVTAVTAEGSGLDHYVRDDGRVVIVRQGVVAAAIPRPRLTARERLAEMDAADVATQVLSLTAPFPKQGRIALMGEINDIFARDAREARGRYKVFARLPLPDVDAAEAEFDRIKNVEGVVGVALGSTIDGRELDEPEFEPIWRRLSDEGAVVFVHGTSSSEKCNRDYALSMSISNMAQTATTIARLAYAGHLERFSGIRWIFAHLGGVLPFLIHRLDNYYQQFPENRKRADASPSRLLQRVYFDTVSTHPPALRCAFDTFDTGQFMFGTDFPHVPGGMKRFAETLAQAGLTDDQLAAVGWRTATALLRLDVEAPEGASNAPPEAVLGSEA